MLNLAITNQQFEELSDHSDKSVLIICESITSQALLTEKCIDAGVKEENIFHHNSIFNIQEIMCDELTHVIIDACLYNYFVFSVLDKYINESDLSILIYHGEDGLKTIRLITDNRLLHINSMTTTLLMKKLLDE